VEGVRHGGRAWITVEPGRHRLRMVAGQGGERGAEEGTRGSPWDRVKGTGRRREAKRKV
jgi:hypothetical protein